MDNPKVLRVIAQEPDESLFDALGNQHSLESAIADIIDNSIDHGASTISIQFISDASRRLTRIRVRDDGEGMSPEVLEEAMQLRRKKYSQNSLSFFGVGMKMAALSQGSILRVFSRSEYHQLSGAQLRRQDAGGKFETEILDDEFSRGEYLAFTREKPGSGTVIEIQKLDSVSMATNERDRVAWINSLTDNVGKHLSLIFHRFIESATIRIAIEQWEEYTQRSGARRILSPTNPFQFSSPDVNFPASFYSRTLNKSLLELECHLVPPNSEAESVRINSLNIENWAGFWVYRFNRIIQSGGWQDIVSKRAKDFQLARIKIELSSDLLDSGVKITSEKKGVRFSEEFKTAVLSSKSEKLSLSFDGYLERAAEIRKKASKRSSELKPMTRVLGLENQILGQSLAELIGFRAGGDSIEIVSKPLKEDQVFELDLDAAQLRINSDLFEEDGPLASEPAYEFFKATLYFLLESHFSKTAINKSTYAKIEQIHRVLAISLGIQQLQPSPDENKVIPTPAMVASKMTLPAFQPMTRESDNADSLKTDLVWSSGFAKGTAKSATGNLRSIRADEPPKIALEDVSEIQKSDFHAEPLISPQDASQILEALKLYKKQSDVSVIAQEMGIDEFTIVAWLAETLLTYTSRLDNDDEAYLAGEPFNVAERQKVVAWFQDGHSIVRISQDTGRTAYQVARTLLDSPRLQLKADQELLRILREIAKSGINS